jgi:hypothetical protein
MPIYEYESRNGLVRAEFVRPVADRDKPAYQGTVRLYRVTAPSRVNVINGAVEPTDQNTSVLKGLKRLEDTQGSKFNGLGKWSKSDLKKIWSE